MIYSHAEAQRAQRFARFARELHRARLRAGWHTLAIARVFLRTLRALRETKKRDARKHYTLHKHKYESKLENHSQNSNHCTHCPCGRDRRGELREVTMNV